MNLGRASAALLMALLVSGCANLWSGTAAAPEDAGNNPSVTAISPPAETPAPVVVVQVTVAAPEPLKALLEQYLDLVRLGLMAGEEVAETEWSRLIAATPGQVRSLLQTEGYFSPEVELSRMDAAGQPSATGKFVRLQVEPGPRALISRVTLQVQGELERAGTAGDPQAQATLSAWRNAWELPSGADFRNSRWSDAKASALARLRAAGYANANWDGTAADVDIPNSAVRLFLVVDSGPQFRYGQLQIEGLAPSNDKTVHNLLSTPAGAPITETLLLDFQDRLQRSNLYEGVTVTLDTSSQDPAQASILVRAVEAAPQVYTFGAGISANNGPRASVEHLYRRFFGLDALSRSKIELGKQRQALDAELSTHPQAGLFRYLLGGAVERQLSDNDTVLSQRLRLGRSQDKGSLERLHFLEFERSLRTTNAGDRIDSIALSVNFHGAWRALDSLVLPTRGVSLAVQVSAGRSNSTRADDGYFSRAYGRLTGYLPLGRSWYGQARIELGQAFAPGSVVVPESQKWRAGGDDSVRGYAYRSLGPLQDGVVGSGKAIFTSSVEIARPFVASMPALWGALFVDLGGAADKLQEIHAVTGYGVGIRYRSPVGPLKLDYAWAPERKKGRLHFTVGITF